VTRNVTSGFFPAQQILAAAERQAALSMDAGCLCNAAEG